MTLAVGRIAGRIRRAKNTHSGCSDGLGDMHRTGIARDHDVELREERREVDDIERPADVKDPIFW